MRPTPPQPLENNVVAYQQVLTQTPEAEQLAFSQQQLCQLISTISLVKDNQFQESTLAAYQSTHREKYSRDGVKDEKIKRLREEILQLKAALRDLKPPRSISADNYARNRAPHDITAVLSYALEEIRRMQSRMDGFMRAYASRHNHQDQSRVRTRDSRHICEICGKTGHVRQQCNKRKLRNIAETVSEDEPRIAAYQQAPTQSSRKSSSHEVEAEQVHYARRSQPPPSSSTHMSTQVPAINTIDSITTNAEMKGLSQRENDKHEIVVRIEICTKDKATNVRVMHVTAMPSPPAEELPLERSLSPDNNTLTADKESEAEVAVRTDNIQIKRSLRPTKPLDKIEQ